MNPDDPRDLVGEESGEPVRSSDARRELLRRSEAYRRNPGAAVPLQEALERIERSADVSHIDPADRVIRVGCAGWSLPREAQERFPAEGSHLERYAARFPAVEINTSFHRPHRPSTYARWGQSVPAGFRFSVKLPKAITHGLRLQNAEDALDAFLAEAGGLGGALGCLLVQLPPSLAFDPAVARAFFAALRARSPVPVACEPRHPDWFTAGADALLREMGVARVAADPARVAEAALPGGAPDLAYHRLHGSPRVYYSAYDDAYLDALAARLSADAAAGRDVWCIFDNTAAGAATGNALDLLARLGTSAIG